MDEQERKQNKQHQRHSQDHNPQEEAPSYQWVWEQLDRHLERHLLKRTHSRKRVVEFFLNPESPGHVSAEEIFHSLKSEGSRIGLATIYRALNLLVDAHILEQHYFQNQNAVYELKHPGKHHDHLVCLDCGRIEEFEDEWIERRQEKIAQDLGFQLSFHKHELFGHCVRKKCPSKMS